MKERAATLPTSHSIADNDSKDNMEEGIAQSICSLPPPFPKTLSRGLECDLPGKALEGLHKSKQEESGQISPSRVYLTCFVLMIGMLVLVEADVVLTYLPNLGTTCTQIYLPRMSSQVRDVQREIGRPLPVVWDACTGALLSKQA